MNGEILRRVLHSFGCLLSRTSISVVRSSSLVPSTLHAATTTTMEQIVAAIVSTNTQSEHELKQLRHTLAKNHAIILASAHQIDAALSAIDPRVNTLGYVYLLYAHALTRVTRLRGSLLDRLGTRTRTQVGEGCRRTH